MKKKFQAVLVAVALGFGALMSAPAIAQTPSSTTQAATAPATTTPAVTPGASPATAESALPAPPPRMKPVATIGQPQPGEMTFQKQFTKTGRYALWMHDAILMPVITFISLLVLGLMLWVIVRYRRSVNPEPSRTTHNTTIEVIWTLVPVLILIGIAIPSIDLLAKQYKPAPKDALTVKVTGYQWYWGYAYPDNGISEYVSHMLPPEKAIENGEPPLLAADNRLVLPVGVPIKLIITGSDVIHSFSVPAFWVKEDAVPGRLNEKTFTIDKAGVYYGVCSELCGDRHGFMPIAVEALPPAQFKQWVRSQGGHAKDQPSADTGGGEGGMTPQAIRAEKAYEAKESAAPAADTSI